MNHDNEKSKREGISHEGIMELSRAFQGSRILLSAIIHSNLPQENQSLFNKVSKSLNPGGRIVISDFIMNDDRVTPAFGAFFALNMLVNTPEGDTYTEQEVKEWITRAGMSFVEGKGGLMIGRKED